MHDPMTSEPVPTQPTDTLVDSTLLQDFCVKPVSPSG